MHLTIGLIGLNDVGEGDILTMQAAMPRLLSTFVDRGATSAVTLLTPLAPGADAILTAAGMAWLDSVGIDFSVEVVRTLPAEAALADGPWRDRHDEAPITAMRQVLHDRRTTVVNRVAGDVRAETWLGAQQKARRHRAYRRANTLIACRVDVLAAYLGAAAAARARPGGTAEAVARAHRLAAKRRRNGALKPEVVLLA